MKTFLDFFEINRGLERQFVGSYPNLPPYVSKEILRNRIGPRWKPNNGNGNGNGNGHDETIATQQDFNTIQSFQDIHKNFLISKLVNSEWTKRPVLIEVGPSDFDPFDQIKFLKFRFGLNPQERVRNDANRFEIQRQKVRENGSANEPIVVLKIGDKYEMQEGWHRLMSYFLSVAAPQHMEKLRRGNMQLHDLQDWPKVQIKAYVGTPCGEGGCLKRI